jgi:hypothetical protein
MGVRSVVVYALGALVALGFGVALWSAGDIANACDPVTGVGCDSSGVLDHARAVRGGRAWLAWA